MYRIETSKHLLAVYAKGNKDAGRLAVVLPGFLDTKDYAHIRSHVDYLAARGYFAVSFDPPGTWESGDDIRQYTTSNYLLAVEGLLAKFDKPAFIVGHSLGGRVGILASLRSPHVFACASIMSGASIAGHWTPPDKVASWKTNGTLAASRDLPYEPQKRRQFYVPFSFYEDALQYDARHGLDKLTIPKLFVAGRQDPYVPTGEVQEVFDAAGDPKQLVMLDASHVYRRQPRAVAAINDALQVFLDNAEA